MSGDVVRLIRKNTLTNYLSLAIRLVQGVLVTRWMFESLGEVYYGFWALLWAVFFYVLVLEFGFSKAAQKYTAEQLFDRDPAHYNRVVSAVFSLQWLTALVILLVTYLASFWLKELTRMEDPGQLAYCRTALLVFSVGIAVTFPTGIFPEILIGLKAIYLRNYVMIGGRLAELIGIYTIFSLGGSLLSLVIFTVILNFSLNMVMLAVIYRKIPSFRLRLGFRWATLRELADFSLFTYLNSMANLVIGKTDLMILSIMTGLSDVGIYQLGTRMPAMLNTLSSQYQENVAPFTADLCHRNEKELLCRIIVSGLRLTAWLITGGAAVLFVLTPEVLQFLFKVHDPLVISVCRWMTVCGFFSVAFRSFPTRIMLMAGYHRALSYISWGEAITNLGSSILLVYHFGLIGVVYGTLLPNVLIGCFVMLPFCCRFVGMALWRMLAEVYLAPALGAAAMVAGIWLLRMLLPEHWLLFWRLLLLTVWGGAIYLAISWRLVFTSQERKQVLVKLHLRAPDAGEVAL